MKVKHDELGMHIAVRLQDSFEFLAEAVDHAQLALMRPSQKPI